MGKTKLKHTAPRLSAQILEEASAWFVDFNEGDVDPAAREEFNRWLRTSPEHVRAYLQISAFWEEVPARKQGANHDALIARALTEENVIPLSRDTRKRAMASVWRRPVTLAASAAVLFLLAGAVAWLQWFDPPAYATEVGEQRSIRLADGSTVELNSRSRVRIRFDDRQRIIDLTEGQAIFRVAKDVKRPFIVRSGATSVRAVGTQFDVYRRGSGTIVTVIEGRVAVLSPDASAFPGRRPLPVSAGEQVTVTAQAVALPKPANVAAATAWTQGKLMFESSSLADVVAEFNRYNSQQLVIDDARLREFHISGVFPSTDSERLVQFLQQRFDVAITKNDSEIRIGSSAVEK